MYLTHQLLALVVHDLLMLALQCALEPFLVLFKSGCFGTETLSDQVDFLAITHTDLVHLVLLHNIDL